MISNISAGEIKDAFDEAIRLDRVYSLGSAAAIKIDRALNRVKNYHDRGTHPYDDELLAAWVRMAARFRELTGLWIDNGVIKRDQPNGG